jgi:hypothetical protein
VTVPAAASKLAQPGWSMNVTLARKGIGWQMIEVSDVYP